MQNSPFFRISLFYLIIVRLSTGALDNKNGPEKRYFGRERRFPAGLRHAARRECPARAFWPRPIVFGVKIFDFTVKKPDFI
jgi:hypothetical protein